jgi:hypothetical protein
MTLFVFFLSLGFLQLSNIAVGLYFETLSFGLLTFKAVIMILSFAGAVLRWRLR